MKDLYRIEHVGAAQPITRKDGTMCVKQVIVLRELGNQWENRFAATYLGDRAVVLSEGTLVAAALRFSTRTYEGNTYQDVTLQEYVSLAFPPMPSINVK